MSAKITITDTVLTGNMGEGWTDVDAAASAYARYLESEYHAAAKRRFPGTEIDVSVRVQNATGWCGDPAVTTDDYDLMGSEMSDFERDLADGQYWQSWIDSVDAMQHIAE
jgi:hypothetical protein